MKLKYLVFGGVSLAILFAIAVWNGPKRAPNQPDVSHEDFDPNAAPKEAIQRAWRTADQKVFVQYTYTGPNACWQKGNTTTLSMSDDVATFTVVPEIIDAFCAQAMTAITYDQELEIPQEIEILKVVVEHPEGGLIERNELWIEPTLE